MIREWSVNVYLFLFQIQFCFFKLFPKKNKVVFVVSFSENTKYVAEEFKRENVQADFVFLCRGSCLSDFSDGCAAVIPFETLSPLPMLRSAYHLATSKIVFVDNYFGFLSVVRFRKGVQCIQLWHAAGALKTFGLEDRSIAHRTRRARRRFVRVYDRFDKVIVGSEKMADIFKRSFGIKEDRILRTGIPQTDFFYNIKNQEQLCAENTARTALKQMSQVTLISRDEEGRSAKPTGTKIKILYAPTFRDHELDDFQLHLDLDLMERSLGGDYVLLLRLHPAVRGSFVVPHHCSGFVLDCSKYRDINELLVASDILVTDYSSLPVAFALLGRPMIFYPYDLEDYGRERGFQENYMNWVPGPVAFSTEDIASVIKKGVFDLDKVAAFSDQWNTYSKGRSSRNVVGYVKEITDLGG